MKKQTQIGVSLIEMAIVLTIIAAIMAGILAGKDLVGSSNRSKLISDFKQFKIAYDQFKAKYEGIPGDISDATSYWSAAKNGNGNLILNDSAPPTYDESYLAWNHLTRAKMIKGNYSGTSSGVAVDAVSVGVNLPAAAYGGISAYNIMSNATTRKDYVHIGSAANANDTALTTGVVPDSDTVSIDKKIDDGDATIGAITYGTCTATKCVMNYFLN